MATSFSFPTRAFRAKLAADAAPHCVIAEVTKESVQAVSKELIRAQSLTNFGMLNLIGIPTGISDSPPALHFGTLAVTIPQRLLGQIKEQLAHEYAAFAVTAARSGDGWQAQSCERITVTSPTRAPAPTHQAPGATTSAQPTRAEVEVASCQPAQRQLRLTDRTKSMGGAASRFGSRMPHTPPGVAAAPAASPVSFARRSAAPQAVTGKSMNVEVDLDEIQDIPF